MDSQVVHLTVTEGTTCRPVSGSVRMASNLPHVWNRAPTNRKSHSIDDCYISSEILKAVVAYYTLRNATTHRSNRCAGRKVHLCWRPKAYHAETLHYLPAATSASVR